MSIKYKYEINGLEHTNDANRCVFMVHYDVKAFDLDVSKQTVDSYGKVSFLPDPNSSNFVPFEELNEEIVLNWVKSNIDTTKVEEKLAQRLNKKLNSNLVSGIPPWAETDETES